MRRWTLEKRLKRGGQASKSVLDCDRVIIPVRKLRMPIPKPPFASLDVAAALPGCSNSMLLPYTQCQPQ